jgi:hypothetical protein
MGICNRCKTKTPGYTKLCDGCRKGDKRWGRGTKSAATPATDDPGVAGAIEQLVDRKLAAQSAALDSRIGAVVEAKLRELAQALTAAANT